jgi:hypothetical protein
MAKRGQQYFSYLLRAWREREDSHWRFSLEGVNDGEQVYFASFQHLVAHLAALIQNPRHLIRHHIVELEDIPSNTDPIISEK